MSTHHQSQRVSDGHPPLEQEQAMADLDQSVADREQALADVDQATVERDQADKDGRSPIADPSDFAKLIGLAQEQAELDRRQARGDARQDQIEHAQTGGDDRQTLLDSQQQISEQPQRSATPTELPSPRSRGSEARRERSPASAPGPTACRSGRATCSGAEGTPLNPHAPTRSRPGVLAMYIAPSVSRRRLIEPWTRALVPFLGKGSNSGSEASS